MSTRSATTTNDNEQQWRDEPATERQLAYIAEMQEFSPYPIARFDGTTKGDASDYIDRWKEMSHESTWEIEHGY